MKTTVKALDNYDALKAGHEYSVRSLAGSKLLVLSDTSTCQLFSLYKWQIEDALLRGKLCYVDNVQSPAMSCSAVASLCHRLPTRYIY